MQDLTSPKRVTVASGSMSDADLLKAAVPVPFALGPAFSSAAGPKWSEGPEATITVDLPDRVSSHELLIIDACPFVVGRQIRHQIVELSVEGQFCRDWTLLDGVARRRAIMVERRNTGQATRVEIGFRIKTCPAPDSPELAENRSRRGVAILGIRSAGVDDPPSSESLIWQLGRVVGAETQKTFDQRIETGFWAKYVRGPNILDIGFRGGEGGLVVPVFDGAIGVDIGYPGYDGRTLPFPDNSQDMVFSSHCLEHIPAYVKALQEWHRVLKIGGHAIIAVPHAHLYERRRRPPSRWNTTHERFYTPAALLSEVESALKPNSYRVRFCEENDAGYRYDSDPMLHARGCYEVVLVLQKIVGPTWRIEE